MTADKELHFGPHPMPFRRGDWAVKVERPGVGWWIATLLLRGQVRDWAASVNSAQEALDRLWETLRPLLDPLPDEPPPEGGEGDVIEDLIRDPPPEGPPVPVPDLAAVESLAGDIARWLLGRLGVSWADGLMSRRAKGIENWGRPLRYGDGRGLVDAAQEALDLVAYLRRERGRR